MAEDKKKEDGKADDGKKRRGLPAFLLVAIGAIAGGAGVVFAVPPKTVEKTVEAAPKKVVDVTHPDPIEHAFNPRSKAGKGVASVQFKFVYTVREDLEPKAYEAIKENWDVVKSNTLLILKQRSIEELQTEAGTRMLEKDLLDDLDRTLFRAGRNDEKVATVTRVLWLKTLIQ